MVRSGATSEVTLQAIRGSWLLFGRSGVTLLVNLLGSLVAARLLGPKIWGLYAIALYVLGASQEILGRGIALYLIQRPDEPHPDEVATVWAVQQRLALIAALLICTWVILRRRSLPEGLAVLLIAAAIGAVAYAVRSIPVALLERKLVYSKVALIELLDTLTFNITMVAGAFVGQGILGLAFGLALRGIVPAATALGLARQKIHYAVSLRAARGVLSFSVPTLGINIMNVLIGAAPVVLIGRFLNVEVLGVVQLGFSLLGYMLVPVSIITRVALSAFARVQQDRAALNRAIRRTVLLVFFVLIPILTIITGLSPLWTALYGPRWLPMARVLLAAYPGFLLGGGLWPLSSALLAVGRPRDLFWFLALFCGAYWLVGVILLRPAGYLAMPIAWSAAHLIASPLLLYRNHQRTGSLDYSMISVAVAVGAAVTALFWLLADGGAPPVIVGPVVAVFVGVWLLVWNEPRGWLVNGLVSGLRRAD